MRCAMKCPICKLADEVQRRRRGPTEMALDELNPLEPYLCARCWRSFWRPKDLRRFVVSSLLALLFVALGVNAGVQAKAFVQGKVYRTADRTQLFVNLDRSLTCPKCGRHDISRSTLRPQDRIVAWLNPFTPYRCWDCWKRFWRLKPPLEAATNLVLLTLMCTVVARGWLRGRRRRREAASHMAVPV